MLQRNWGKCGDDKHWCNFYRVELNDKSTFGVYVMFEENIYGIKATLYVGQGTIQDRIEDHREEKNLPEGALVTWAEVPEDDADDIEAYLIKKLNPSLNVYKPVHPLGGETINLPY